MRQHRSRIVLISITFFLTVLIICVVSADQKQNKANMIYQNMANNLNGYPNLADPYCVTIGYCCIGGNEYVLIKNEGKVVYGMKTLDGNTVYKFEGQFWIEEPDGMLHSTNESFFHEDVVGSKVIELLADQTVTYTYHKASGATLPLIVDPSDIGYLQIQRSGFDKCMEVMVPGDGEQNSMRWSIIQEDGQVSLYIYVTNAPIPTVDVGIWGWGTMPEKAMEYLCG